METTKPKRSQWDHEPDCPHCGETMTDMFDLCLQNDGDETETECGSCEKPLRVTMSLEVSYQLTEMPDS